MEIVIGLVLIIGGVVVAVIAGRRAQAQARAVEEVPLYDTTQIAAHGQDAPGMRVAVAGTVQALPSGGLVAPISQRPCAWYRLAISERVRETSRDSSGKSTTRESENTISEEVSPDYLLVRDASGEILIDPLDASIDNPLETYDRLESVPSQGLEVSFGSMSLNIGSRNGVIGIRKQEEIIPLGSPLYVLGGAYTRDNAGLIAKPREGHFIVSTRSAREVARSARRRVLLWSGIGILCVGGGVGLIVSSVVS